MHYISCPKEEKSLFSIVIPKIITTFADWFDSDNKEIAHCKST